MEIEPKKQRFEIRITYDTTPPTKAIFIDDKLFDWDVDADSLNRARSMGLEYYAAAQRDIQKHFLDSLSEFLGRKVGESDVATASTTGWI